MGVIEGNALELTLGKIRAAQFQAVGLHAPVPDAVVPCTTPETPSGILIQVLQHNRREPGGRNFGRAGFSCAAATGWSRRHYGSDSALAAISAKSFVRAFRVAAMPILPNSSIMILLARVGLMISAPNVRVRSVPPSRGARLNRVV